MLRALRTTLERSASVIWVCLRPRSTSSCRSFTNRSTVLCKKPTRRRPSSFSFRLTSPRSRQRSTVLPETPSFFATSSTVSTGLPDLFHAQAGGGRKVLGHAAEIGEGVGPGGGVRDGAGRQVPVLVQFPDRFDGGVVLVFGDVVQQRFEVADAVDRPGIQLPGDPLGAADAGELDLAGLGGFGLRGQVGEGGDRVAHGVRSAGNKAFAQRRGG